MVMDVNGCRSAGSQLRWTCMQYLFRVMHAHLDCICRSTPSVQNAFLNIRDTCCSVFLLPFFIIISFSSSL